MKVLQQTAPSSMDADYYGVRLPLGPDFGGPLFFAHYSFCGLDPRGLTDHYADYWEQNCSHAGSTICTALHNPHGYIGYGQDCWGLTSSHGPRGYVVSSPGLDFGLIAPTAALSSLPYVPEESMRALRHFLALPHGKMNGGLASLTHFRLPAIGLPEPISPSTRARSSP